MATQSGHNVARGITTARDPYLAPEHDLVSDERLLQATGRTLNTWFEELDDAGAQDWDRGRIARWLGAGEEADTWWAQWVSKQYRTLRKNIDPPSAVYTESFEVRVTKTIHQTMEEIWPYIDDDDLRARWLDVELRPRSRTPGKSLRLALFDHSRVSLSLLTLPPKAHGRPRTQVITVHNRIRKQEFVPETHAFWKAALEDLYHLMHEVYD
ncbi:MAG: hypothetical protein PUK40_07015 [Actinomycetaceae bacterium]|nr:hypothetical protein [Arcanobacterium sp.]MDD7505670.1 hypothetical protein [Actinomycetaceae bacterium]MDY6143455.1 hypothetical protein [Arcanobacterium sp.]